MPPAESPLQQKDAVLALLPPTALVRLRNTAKATPPAQDQELRNGTHELPTNQDILDRLIKVEGLISDLKASFDHGKASPAPIEHDEDAPGPVLVPPAQPPQEAPIGEGVRGSYVDNSVFVKLFLDVGSTPVSIFR
ncbi:hypothetical protein APSETT444_002082 [Aspergillus pseudonomiae]